MSWLRLIRNVISPPTKGVDWIRPCHEREYHAADRMGLKCVIRKCDALGRSYLDLKVESNDIGAIRFVRSSECVVLHRSTKVPDMWQASWFDNGVPGKDDCYSSLQEGVDAIRLSGMIIHSVMTNSGEILE